MPDYDRWNADGGEKLRFDYRIKSEDLALDCGAYHGTWSRQIYDRYRCKIVAFEPIKAYYDITVRTLDGTAAAIFNAGIGPVNTICDISIDQDASSILTHSAHRERIRIMSVNDIMREPSLSHIRLMKINIEGAEYDLLDHMLNTALVNRVEDIQIQFHQFVASAEQRRESIRARLCRTHRLTYDYEFVWENWHALNAGN